MIPKRQSESVYRRRTDTTMAKRKSTKGKTTIMCVMLIISDAAINHKRSEVANIYSMAAVLPVGNL